MEGFYGRDDEYLLFEKTFEATILLTLICTVHKIFEKDGHYHIVDPFLK